MGYFYYFIPTNRKSLDADNIGQWGLSHAFDRSQGYVDSEIENGPGDVRRGTILVSKQLSDKTKLCVRPDQQTWKMMPPLKGQHEGKRVWCGYYNDERPTPEALQRRELLNGHAVRLGDDRLWLCPIAVMFAGSLGSAGLVAQLPTRSDLDDDGNWVATGIVDKYRRAWDVALEYWDARVVSPFQSPPVTTDEDGNTIQPDRSANDGPLPVITFDGAHDAAVDALSVNYRVGRAEAAALGLLDNSIVRQILDVLIDYPGLMSWSKKNSVETPDTYTPQHGDAAGSPTTGPQSLTSTSLQTGAEQ